jgi:uncharacterized protein YjbJ (UPF0337 family)
MNTSHLDGAVDTTKGKIKQAIGETFNDQSLANEGAADQVRGHAKEAWGSVKDTASNLSDHAKAEASHEEGRHEVQAEKSSHDFRQSVTDAAAHAKESLQHGLDKLEEKIKH